MKTRLVVLTCVCVFLASAQELTEREKRLLDQVERLESRVAALEGKLGLTATATAPALPSPTPGAIQSPTYRTTAPPPDASATTKAPEFNYGLIVDGYYAYNLNHPQGNMNTLRSYDQSNNSFSINQADIVLERPVNLDAGRRFGARIDLQYGQATQALQGNPANEPRPDLYRYLFQAYGTYVVPVGSGLTVDFGKWVGALGFESVYTKDQLNYSRSLLFSSLPSYHMGVRANYAFNDKANLTWWLVNGLQQTEDFNSFKSNAFLLNVKPTKSISWNVNYYFGEENMPDGSGRVPHGKTHIFDTYASWTGSKGTTIGAEGDYIVGRIQPDSRPSHLSGGAAYLRQQLPRDYAVALRTEYISNRGHLLTDVDQALKETTLTFERKLADGFLLRTEWRRDFSNVNFFPTSNPNVLRKSQTTATLGLIWWVGNKQGSW